MASTPQSFGPAKISTGTGTSQALEELGYTRQGADIRDQAFFLDVPGDENGGDQGPPIDIQYLGEIAIIRLELTKWDETVAAKVRSRLASGTEGQPGTAGTFMFQDSKTIRVLVEPTTGPMNFPRAFLRREWEINKGTRYSTLVLEFEAHKDASGDVYNSTTT
jgi:hypothetical protein